MQEIRVVGDIYEDNGLNSQGGRIYDAYGLAPTLSSTDYKHIKIIIEIKEVKDGESKDN